MDNSKPLAYRMSPQTLDDYAGQEHIIGKGKMLRRMIEADRLSSIILFGPPGVGKTALARVIANTTSSRFEQLNAVTAGVSDIKKIVSDASNPLLSEGRKTVLFIDEIFEVNKALVSRSTVCQLKPLEAKDIVKILKNAITDKERGFGTMDVKISDETLIKIAETSNGDARTALNSIELAVITTPPSSDGSVVITDEVMKECIQTKTVLFDKDGEYHYDNISAMIKSMRGSDPNAAVLYLARALAAGEDIEFLARRIMICASEDVGMANPNALLVAVAAYECARAVGMPEARIPLAEAAITVATSPKSNASYLAIGDALRDVQNTDTGVVPMHLRNAPAKGMEELGYSVGYKYPHDFPGHITEQQYMTDKTIGKQYYKPTDIGYERKVNEYLDYVKKMIEQERGNA